MARKSSKARTRIEVTGAGKNFGDLRVFHDINLTISDREIVTIVGPSGCGKTTLLRCIDGLIELSEGGVEINGEPVAGPPKNVAMVFQHFGLFPWKTVIDNVAYGLKLAGMPRQQARDKASDFMKMVGLQGFENNFPYQLSGGMQQRCGLARALALEPNVMLMDEPFAAVDAQTREILQFELLHIWGTQDRAMVFVTHSIEEAVLMGDRVVVLKGRPSSVHEIVDVPLPKPRDRGTLALKQFAKLREHVWSTLMDEARNAEFDVRRQ
jgi:NitT/TauT family transport system ATP-binding protein